jgi:crotonobetainyl-CoA:carnitine CoA-transferase CaiB-like acyl-CoA transferase
MAQFAVTGKPAAPMPERVSAWAIYDVFETRDDPLFIGVVTDALWEKFCHLFGLGALWADESLRKNNQRVLARQRILPEVRAVIATFTRAELIAKLDGSGLPFAPIGRPEELFDDPHLAASQGLEPVKLDSGAKTRLPTLPLEMGGARPHAEAQLPAPGADSRAILARLGLTPDRIDQLIRDGVVGDSA